MKKHHWHVFRHEKLFEKQPLPHYQTPSQWPTESKPVNNTSYFIFLN